MSFFSKLTFNSAAGSGPDSSKAVRPVHLEVTVFPETFSLYYIQIFPYPGNPSCHLYNYDRSAK